ncbi:hypothetical protein SUGI_0841000 [Cryptomeria japonica]|nr:hypothetical protein SUGI_0841000 [Cryptomeria japonica]
MEPLKWIGFGHCGHRSICSVCIVRLRFIVGDKTCCICKQHCPTVFITKDLGDYTTGIGDCSVFPALEEDKNRQYWFHEDSQAYFDDEEQYNRIKAMCGLCCSICDSISQEAGKGFPKGVLNFQHIDQLKKHLFHMHSRSFCELCLEGRKVFICEQKLYAQKQLHHHFSRGDSEVDGDERDRGGYTGHPMCNFCKKRFYGENELFQHMSTEHYTCHLCQRMNPGHYEYFQNYNDLEVHFRQQHFLCENAECLAKKFVVFMSELGFKKHNTLQHGGKMSRSQRSAALQIPVSFRYRHEVYDIESHQSGRRQRHNAHDHETAALEASIELPIFDNAIHKSSMMRETSQNLAKSEVINRLSSSSGTVSSSSNITGTNIPSRCFKTVSPCGLPIPLDDSSFPPLPMVTMSTQKKAETTGQTYGKTMARTLRCGKSGTVVVNREEPREIRQHSLSGSVSSGGLSSSVCVTSAVSQANSITDICLMERSSLCTSSGVQTYQLTSPDIFGGTQANGDNFLLISGANSACSVSISEKQNSCPSSVPLVNKKEMHAANKALVKHIWSVLGENEKQFAAFKNVSTQYRHYQIDAQKYYSCICELGLLDIVLEFVRLSPETHKQKELLDIHNANIQKSVKNTLQTDIRVMDSPVFSDNSNKDKKEKSKVGVNCRKDPTFNSILSSIHSLELGRKASDENVKVLLKDEYWAGEEKGKKWKTNDPCNASKAVISLIKTENNLNSELLVSQSFVPACCVDIDSTERWSCLVCTLINEVDCSHCVACGMEHPKNKSKEESNTKNTMLQTDIQVMGSPMVSDNSNTCKTEKSKGSGSFSVVPTSSSTLVSKPSWKLGRKHLDEKVKVLCKGRNWAGREKANILETNDPGNAAKTVCLLNMTENNLNSEVFVEASWSSVPACGAENIDSIEIWSCLVCTLINKADCSHCAACGIENPKNKSNPREWEMEKYKKKTSKFHRTCLGDGSTASFLDLGNKEHNLNGKAKGTFGNTEKLSSHSVWNNGGGQRLVALAQRNHPTDMVWNSLK